LVTLSIYQEENEEIEERIVRFRTVGDMSCTAAVDSYAATISEVVGEIRLSTISERGPELTINVLKQWKKENNKGTFRMKFLKLFFSFFF
jgi:3'-phosphoadenosine 5'-phosphosulfate sulfotransferase (PAPS reductase)/FAD synthetase